MTTHSPAAGKKTEYVHAQMRGKILSGQWQPGHKLLSERKIAEEYAVSRLVVREALSSLDNEGLITRIQGSGNYVREDALLETDVKQTITLLYPARKGIQVGADPYYLQLTEGIHAALDRAGSSSLLALCPLQPGQKLAERIPPQDWANAFAGGLLLHPELLTALDMQLLVSDGIKMVALGRPEAESDIPFVDIDNVSGIGQAVTHLIELGHRDILFLNGPDELVYCRSRSQGFAMKMQQYGVKHQPDQSLTVLPWDAENACRQVCRAITEKTPFSAVLVAGDRACLGCVKALQDAGLTLPDDVSLVAYGDTPDFYEWSSPPITAVAQPLSKLGEEGMKMLQKLHERGAVKQTNKLLLPELVLRRSTRRHA